MAEKSIPSSSLSLSFFILFFISTIPHSSTQSTSPQNIQTFYPTLLPPPSRPLENPAKIPSPPRQTKSSTRAAVGKAIGVTAATALFLSGLIFFLVVRYSRRKRNRDVAATTNVANSLISQNGNNDKDFVRFNGNVKGVIVDENGLDVLYWKNLEDGENRGSFLKTEQNEEEKRIISNNRVQEVPLLRENSSTSQTPVWGEIIDPNLPPEAPPSAAAVSKEKIIAPPPPLPPPPPPPPPSPLAIGAVRTGEVTGQPPPPPPPPPTGGASTSGLKPPVPNKPSSSGEGGSGKGNGQVKLKPLHWDKVNPNVKHSMVWDKIDNGSFK